MAEVSLDTQNSVLELFKPEEIEDEGILSSTKITTYMGCSMAHFLRYIEHVKVRPHVRFAAGKGIHHFAEDFYLKNYRSPESFANAWKWYWSNLASGDGLDEKRKEETRIREYPIKKGIVKLGDHIDFGQDSPGADPVGIYFGYMRMGAKILERFYKNHIAEKRGEDGRVPPKFNEFGFGTSIPFIINGHRVRGFLDRIDKINGIWRITDYKTDKGSPANDPFTLHRHPQFTMYSYVFRELFKAEEEAIFFYHLRSGEIFETHRSEKDFDYLKGLLDKVAKGIRNRVFFPFYGFHCKFCDLRPACEKYNASYRGGPSLNLEGKLKPVTGFEDWDATLTGRGSFLEQQSEPN